MWAGPGRLPAGLKGPVPMNMEGTRPSAYEYGGHPAPTGRALPNLINAVRMLKSKSKTAFVLASPR